MMNLETAFADTSYDMELEKIKEKIQKLYRDLVVKTFKAANPVATQEEIDSFLEENTMEFSGQGFNEEADGLEKILDLLMEDEDLDEASEMSYEEYDVAKGSKMKAKSKEGTTAPSTASLKAHKGGLFTPSDSRTKTNTKSLKLPRGKIERLIDDAPKVDTKTLEDVWDAERDKLLKLVRRRNKEHGVKF